MREVLDASETVNAARIADLCGSRQNAYWANAEKPTTEDAPRAALHKVYDAIAFGAAFLALKGEVGAHLRSNSAAETWKLYTDRLYQFDQLYRLFGEAADVAEAQNWDVLKDLRSHIEDVYGNWYLVELGALWTRQVETDLLPGWRLPEVRNQYDFYSREVKRVLDVDPGRRVVVIISDAFRFEAAQELFKTLEGKDRFQAKLDSMLGVLPSYTALGMSALLPHDQLGYAADGTVLVDGKAANGLEARKKLLDPVGGIAIKAADLMEMKKDDGIAFFKPYRVIYVYHDQIDQTADKGNEEKTFVAVRTTINEIAALIRRAFTFNCNRALVTADHGFLFQSAAPTGHLGLYRMETQITAGNGKFAVSGIGSSTAAREALKVGFDYFKANLSRVSGASKAGEHDYHVHIVELQNSGATTTITLAGFVAACSGILQKPLQGQLVVLGDMSLGGAVKPVENLAGCMQLAFDCGAKRVLLPMSSVTDIPTIPGELFAKFQTSFYADPVDAVFKALGVD